MSRHIPDTVRHHVIQRDSATCVYCGRRLYRSGDRPLEIDHVIPFSLGGESTVENLVCACRNCNRRKQAKQGLLWKPRPVILFIGIRNALYLFSLFMFILSAIFFLNDNGVGLWMGFAIAMTAVSIGWLRL